MRTRALLFALALGAAAVGPLSARAQSAAEPLLSSAALEEDVDVLRRVYQALHPGLYRYNTKAEMDAAFVQLSAQFAHGAGLPEAYLRLSEFAAKIRCGHTYANFYNQPDSVVDAAFSGKNRVPFGFRWIGRTMIVTRDLTPDGSLPRGSEIRAIDGVAAPAILEALLPLARADGANDAKRIDSLGVNAEPLHSKYQAFDIFYPLVFHPAPGRFHLRVRKFGDGADTNIDAPAFSQAEREAGTKAPPDGAGSPQLFSWSYLRDGAAYLRMPTWALYNSKWEWRPWLEARLDEATVK